MEGKEDKFKLLRDEDGVIVIHDGEAERREGYIREGYDKQLSKEDILKKFDKFKTNDR